MKFFALSLLALILGSHSFAAQEGGDGVGNAGDGIAQIFEEARVEAIRNVERFDICNAPKKFPKNVIDWIQIKRTELIADLKESAHVWVHGGKNISNTCAWAGRDKDDKPFIVLSTKECKQSDYTVSRAAALLIHESSHHLGVTEKYFGKETENFAWDIANAIRKSAAMPACPYDPWSADSCKFDGVVQKQGPAKEGTGKTSTLTYATIPVGEYRIFSRRRVCHSAKGCTPYVFEEGTERTFQTALGKEVVVPAVGPITVHVDAQTNNIYLKTVGQRMCRVLPELSICDFGAGPGAENDLYEVVGDKKQKISFLSVFTGKCLRQNTKLVFVPFPGAKDWVEVEHVITYPNHFED
jgi:hypothetical protein